MEISHLSKCVPLSHLSALLISAQAPSRVYVHISIRFCNSDVFQIVEYLSKCLGIYYKVDSILVVAYLNILLVPLS